MSHSDTSLPDILIIGTGGTIAGAASSGTTAIYQSGVLDVETLAGACPGIEELARLSFRSVINKDSADITQDDWNLIIAAVLHAINDPSIDGVVITHGTDTLEETAFLLDLVVPADKPVVLVGAMRPATSLSADGPMNLYDAVTVAGCPTSAGRGMLVVMNNEIHMARHVTKTNTSRLDTFASPSFAAVGAVSNGTVRYAWGAAETVPQAGLPFEWSGTKLPEVLIWYGHADSNGSLVDILLDSGRLQGIVIAGMGDGNIPASLRGMLTRARSMGVVVVRSTRVGSGSVTPDYNNLDSTYGLISARALNPQKARILLMLTLTRGNDINEIKRLFDCY